MKKKNKAKIGLILGLISIVLLLAGVVVFIIFKEDKNTSLTILEKRWIEDNKNQIIDIGITYDIPMYSLSNEGVAFDYIKSLEETTGLEFNRVPYQIATKIEQKYYFSNVNELPSKNYILLDSTDYVVISKENKTIQLNSELNSKNIAILKTDAELAKYYLEQNENIKEYETIETLISAYKTDTISYMVLPYTTYLKSILELDNAYVVKNIDEMKQYYIIKLSDKNEDKKLNSIIKKYYEKWQKSNKDELYNKLFINLYYNSKEIDKISINTLNAKAYTYGYVENYPYEGIINNKLYGISGEYINKFSEMTGVDFEFKSFENIQELTKALNKNEIDIALGYYDLKSKKTTSTLSIGNTDLVVLTHNTNNIIINSLKSLKNKEVSVIKGTNIYSYVLNNSEATLKEYNNLKSLMENRNKNSIIIVDEKTYNYYSKTALEDYQIAYRYKIENGYSYIISNTDDNKIFMELFNYYLSFTNDNYQKEGYTTLVVEKASFKNSEKKYLGYALILMVVLLLIIIKILKIGKQNKQNRREEKIRFIDMLTSLKNRNYLNNHMNEWNENRVYPQAIVVIDLNNIKYINDNYGYEEGDNIIGMAANILINTQLENTDIIRTDGNEFLVYMVGYDDKKVIAYIRKLYKELQQLPHEFGAALGYSMIEDEIKTIDDAINEATLEMRKNKGNTD